MKNVFFEKVDVLKRHDKDIQYTAKARNDMASLYKTTIRDLDEFQQLRPIHEKLIQAENENSKKDIQIKEKDTQIGQLKEQLKNFKS